MDKTVENEINFIIDSACLFNGEDAGELFLDGTFRKRRGNAISAVLPEISEERRDDFLRAELYPPTNYNRLDDEDALKIGATLWILEQIQLAGKMKEMMELLSCDEEDITYLPFDFAHPFFSTELIGAVVHVLHERYGIEGTVLTERAAQGKKPGETYLAMLSLLPSMAVERVCGEFKEKVRDITERYLTGLDYYRQEIKKVEQINPLLVAPMPDDEKSKRVEELERGMGKYTFWFAEYLKMTPGKVKKETGSREIGNTTKGFSISDPYGLCFALFYLLDTNDETPWLFYSAGALMQYVCSCLPWWVSEKENWTDEEWDAWYDAQSLLRNNWMETGSTQGALDLYHERHKGLTYAQIIYRMCRCVVPYGTHPFEKERKQLIAEGMNEERAAYLTELAGVLFLREFQREMPIIEDDWWEGTDRSVVETEEDEPAGEVTEDLAATETSVLEEELARAKKEIKSLKDALHKERKDFEAARVKYEQELVPLQMEHRELADLRELVFNQQSDTVETTAKEIVFPHEMKKRVVIFGGHESFVNKMKLLVTGVRFVETNNYIFDTTIIKSADVVWLKADHMTHKQYRNIINNVRKYGIQIRYFTYGGAEKCAEQLVKEDE